jgi:hypothetical protein
MQGAHELPGSFHRVALAMICGVSTQQLPAIEVEQLGRQHAARKLWALRRVTPSALGGRLAPITLVGHFCQTCDAAVTRTGSVGPSSLERALVTHLVPELVNKLGFDLVEINGLIGWAAVAYEDQDPARPGNSTPFGHLADIDALPAQLRTALRG